MGFNIHSFKAACAANTAENTRLLGVQLEELSQLVERRNEWLFEAPSGLHLFRARSGVTNNGDPFPVGEMGPPPATLATQGRFNEQGQQVLYAATTMDIALAEVRPSREQVCSLASLELTRPVKLANMLPTLTNFGLLAVAAQTDQAVWEALCEHLAYQPTMADRELHYRSCRLISSLLMELGAEGILYRTSFYSELWGDYTAPNSSVGVANVVFFDPSDANVTMSQRFLLKWPKPLAVPSPTYVRGRDPRP